MSRRLPVGLYGIADTGFGDPALLGLQLAQGGAQVVQLRAKGWTTAQRIRTGRTLVEHLRPLGVLVIMNDDLDAAVAIGADGLHLGQQDGDLAYARQVLGPNAILGRSTHSPAQASTAEAEADYIGFGPVFATTTKRAAGVARGLEELARVVASMTIPVVAIGGIRLEHLPRLRQAGAEHWAVISDIFRHERPAEMARNFRLTATSPSR